METNRTDALLLDKTDEHKLPRILIRVQDGNATFCDVYKFQYTEYIIRYLDNQAMFVV